MTQDAQSRKFETGGSSSGAAAPHGRRSGPVVAIDASRSRSGGARTHISGILSAADVEALGISTVHVWSYRALLDSLPNAPWLVKHNPPALEKSLLHQMWWQFRHFASELKAAKCDVLLSTDAGTLCRFEPAVVMSRDMLSFEQQEMNRYRLLSFPRLRLFLLRYMQMASLRYASGALFLTRYASTVIQSFTGQLRHVRIVPHGISEDFRLSTHEGSWQPPPAGESIRCVYVSNADVYKHQWTVVQAIAKLRRAGLPVSLELVGAGAGRATERVLDAVRREDPNGEFITVLGATPHAEIPQHLSNAHIFIFASSCENMPNTLVEAMAMGLPIACARRGPMPDILEEAGAYFDPEDANTIATAVERLATDREFRMSCAKQAKALASRYSWKRCATETWQYLDDTHARHTAEHPAGASRAAR